MFRVFGFGVQSLGFGVSDWGMYPFRDALHGSLNGSNHLQWLCSVHVPIELCRTHTHVYIRTYRPMYVYTYIYIYVCMYVGICVCVHICVYVPL